MASGFDTIAPAGNAWAVTPSDSTVFKVKTRALFVGTGGNVAINAFNPETGGYASITYSNVADGTYILAVTDMVFSTGTTASNILAVA